MIDAIHVKAPGAEPKTKEMSRRVAELSGSGLLSAKWSRDTKADANRAPFRDEERSSASSTTNTREAPTSIRAGLYWAIERMLKNSGLLEGGKLKKPFMRIALHGMANREDKANFVIGAGNRRPGEESTLADDKVITWFATKLTEKMGQHTQVKVAVHTLDPKDSPSLATTYQLEDGNIVARKEPKVGTSLSGAGLGLEHFRTGIKHLRRGLSGRFRGKNIKGFGKGFQTIQLEIAKSIRDNEELRNAAENALSEIIAEFPVRFPDLDSLASD